MKCEIIRDDLEISLPVPPGHEEQWEMRSIRRNRKTVEVPFVKHGAIWEHPHAFALVEMGCAVPADEECQIACGMSPEDIRAAMKAQEKVSLGIYPTDYEKFDAGEIVGYNPDGSYKPGPNWKAPAADVPLADHHDEDDE